jgi:hypothetical protein
MKNMSNAERIIRVAIGVVIIGWGLWVKSWWCAIGIVPLLTGIVGWCGLYQVMKNCCPFSKNKDNKKTDEKPKSGGCCCGGKNKLV